MRRSIVLLSTMALTLLVASGVALAVNKVGTDGPDTQTGTNGNDNLAGRGGQDNIFSLDGTDNLAGGLGKDNVVAGDERRRGRGDKNLDGGPGNDRVIADRATLVAPDCEKVVVVHGSKENSFEQSDAFYESIPQSFFEGLPPPP